MTTLFLKTVDTIITNAMFLTMVNSKIKRITPTFMLDVDSLAVVGSTVTTFTIFSADRPAIGEFTSEDLNQLKV